QRGYVTLSVCPKKKKSGAWEMIWIEELAEIAEKSASSPVYPLLKRPDERHVTMHAFNHPVFVEDIVREASAFLKKDKRVARFEVRAVSHESIHNHSAFAAVTC
ncbi:MAG: GTP cyclohydrolase, FolE2/MptA family, partial [bacterium]